LTEGQTCTFRLLVRVFSQSLGAGWSDAHDDLASACLAALAGAKRIDGERVEVLVPAEESAAARAAVETIWRKAARAQLEPAEDVKDPASQAVLDAGEDAEEAAQRAQILCQIRRPQSRPRRLLTTDSSRPPARSAKRRSSIAAGASGPEPLRRERQQRGPRTRRQTRAVRSHI
jgi:hypothetical protein